MKKMLSILCCWLVPAAFCPVFSAPRIGLDMNAVRSQYGEPDGRMSLGSRATWLYPQMIVTFEEGLVASVSGEDGASPRPQRSGTVAASRGGAGSSGPTRRAAEDGFRWPTIFDAIDEDDFRDVQRHLEAGENVNVRDHVEGGNPTPLHLAAGWAGTRVVELLLDHGADVNARADWPYEQLCGVTPLLMAAEDGRRSNVLLLLERGAQIDAAASFCCPDNTIRGEGITPLMRAVSAGDSAMARLLLDAGANIHATMSVYLQESGFSINRATPLHVAALANELALVRLLVERGARVNARTRNGRTPLVLAQEEGYQQVVRYLRLHGGSQ